MASHNDRKFVFTGVITTNTSNAGICSGIFCLVQRKLFLPPECICTFPDSFECMSLSLSLFTYICEITIPFWKLANGGAFVLTLYAGGLCVRAHTWEFVSSLGLRNRAAKKGRCQRTAVWKIKARRFRLFTCLFIYARNSQAGPSLAEIEGAAGALRFRAA